MVSNIFAFIIFNFITMHSSYLSKRKCVSKVRKPLLCIQSITGFGVLIDATLQNTGKFCRVLSAIVYLLSLALSMCRVVFPGCS